VERLQGEMEDIDGRMKILKNGTRSDRHEVFIHSDWDGFIT